MKILNLYSGIGGHRLLMPNSDQHIAVDTSLEVLNAYHELFPDDWVIQDDAYDFYFNRYVEHDFVFATPPPGMPKMESLLIGLGDYPVKPYCLQICSKLFKPKHPIQKIEEYEFCCNFDISWNHIPVLSKFQPIGIATREMIANTLPPLLGQHIYYSLLKHLQNAE